MHGLADAFARLGRMAHADDGAAQRLSESTERVKEGVSDSPGTCPHRQKALNGIEHDQARGEFLELGFEEGEVLQGKRLFFVILVKPISRDKDALAVTTAGIKPGSDGLGKRVFPRHNENIVGLTCLKRGLAFLVRHGIAPGDQRRELEDEQRFPHTRITVEHAESAKGNVGMPEAHDPLRAQHQQPGARSSEACLYRHCGAGGRPPWRPVPYPE